MKEPKTIQEIDPMDAMPQSNEAQLVELAKVDCDAMSTLIDLHYAIIVKFVRRRIGNTSDAEDIIAETFLQMVRFIKNYKQTNSPFVAWLYRIASNEINRHLRWKRIRRVVLLTFEPATPIDKNASDADEVRSLLLKLPLKSQTILSLFYLEELSTQAIAMILDMTESSVRSQLSRARQQMRRLIEPQNPVRTFSSTFCELQHAKQGLH